MTALILLLLAAVALAVYAFVRWRREQRHPPELTRSQRSRIASYLARQRRARLRVVRGGRSR